MRSAERMRAWFALAALLPAAAALASGPRWVTGPPYFTAPAGTPVVWNTLSPRYFTDPGDLSATVNHAAADAMVAAAAAVWNVPTSMLTLAQGGTLAEHVSGADAYLSANGPVFPADVSAANFAAIPIAVIYDSDGSVTDLLLGSGASSPAECRQNAVTEDVDSIVPTGWIQHAIVVLNGRCTGAAPQQQLQMQYQLERAFGRVLGLGWSQTNDNVFTGTPQPTNNQALHWPILHPLDIVCGAYTYQCLPQPFTLRDDDVAGISSLYPSGLVTDPNGLAPLPGKIWSYTQASRVYGTISFPTGQGMQGVNVVVQRQQGGWSIPEAWYDTSSVSGFRFQQQAGNAVTGAAAGLGGSMGSTDESLEGFYDLAWIPDIDPAGAQNGAMYVVVSTEPLNPLYTGAHAVGPYALGAVAPSGSVQSVLMNQYGLGPYTYGGAAGYQTFVPSDAAAGCATASDGTETAPLPVAASGWWSDTLCAHGHAAWSSFSMQAGRTATLEVTAEDESGLATTAKAMPLIGVWAASDPTGTLPTLAATPAAFNTLSLGTTAAGVAAAQAEELRFVVADARGDGRPDFAYQTRVLYADSVAPAATSVNGGQISISGMGFRAGNEVLVNGVAAAVSSWTANRIVAVAPPESAFAAQPSGPVNVEVVDLATGGTSLMTGALTYGGVAPDQMALVTAPPATVEVGSSAVFAVRVTLADGVTPVAGLPVTFSLSGGSVQIGGCPAAPCVVLTDATGLASIVVTPTAFGAVGLQAAAVGASRSVTFAALAQSVTAIAPALYLAAGATVSWTPQVSVVENGVAAGAVPVAWSASGAVSLSSSATVANAQGVAADSATAGPLAAGAQAWVTACAWTTFCAGFTATGVDPAEWRLEVVSGAGQAIAAPAAFAALVVRVTDGNGDPVVGAPVAVYQTMNPVEMPCPARGRCPAVPVLAASAGTAVSDANGLVSIAPMAAGGGGGVVNVAAATGTQGFAALQLVCRP